MIVLPLFWDQYDNATVHELGYGVRLDTYGFADDELPAPSTACSPTPLAEPA
jgi:UDP:flavonoid glycosyltransferase YjiC (YdhE family)